MGKPYDHQYFFAGYGGYAGTMVCESCNQPIFNHAHDWMHYTKTKKGDWRYVCFHRKCYPDQSGWEKIENDKRAKSEKHDVRISALKALAEAMGITCELEFAALAYEALNSGGGDLDDYYILRYGSC